MKNSWGAEENTFKGNYKFREGAIGNEDMNGYIKQFEKGPRANMKFGKKLDLRNFKLGFYVEDSITPLLNIHQYLFSFI